MRDPTLYVLTNRDIDTASCDMCLIRIFNVRVENVFPAILHCCVVNY